MNDKDDPQLGPQKSAAIEGALVEHVRSDIVRARVRRRRRVIALAGAAIVVAAGAVTAGAVLLGSSPVTDTGVVHCFSSPELRPDGSYPGSAVSIAGDGGEQVPVEGAVQACAVLWQQGVFDEGYDPAAPAPPSPRPVPDPLSVCVMADGSAAVVPGPTSICQTLGLAPRE